MIAIRRSALYAFLLSSLLIATSSAFISQTCPVNAREVDGDVVPRPQLPPPQQQGPGLPPLPVVSPCETACNQASSDAITAINATEAALLANATTPQEIQAIRDLIWNLVAAVYEAWRLCLLACGIPIEVVLIIIGLLP
jgi:hypothetical protein